MKTWRLVSGILSIVLSVFVIYQSMVLGAMNTLSQNGDYSGTAGFFVALMMLAGGIVSIVLRNGEKSTGIAILLLFGIAAIIGFQYTKPFPDLLYWSTWCAICAVLGWLPTAVESLRSVNENNDRIFNPDKYEDSEDDEKI